MEKKEIKKITVIEMYKSVMRKQKNNSYKKRRLTEDKYVLYNVTQRLFKKGLDVDELFLIFYQAIFDRIIQIEHEAKEI